MIKLEFKTRGKIITRYEVFSIAATRFNLKYVSLNRVIYVVTTRFLKV